MAFDFRCRLFAIVLPVLIGIASVSSAAQSASGVPGQKPVTAVASASAAAGPSGARLRADTAKLKQLADELQQALDKSGDDKLSLEVIKLAQQVEALSRQVEMEMRNQ